MQYNWKLSISNTSWTSDKAEQTDGQNVILKGVKSEEIYKIWNQAPR